MTKRMLAAALIVALATFAGIGGAAAAPKGGELVELTCTGGVPSGSVIVPPGNGEWTPGHAVGRQGMYVPYAFTFEAWFVPDGGEPIFLGSDSISKPAPRNTRAHLHGTCSFSDAFPEMHPDLGAGTFMFEGTVSVFFTGR